ncbi:MAG: hypothetical protein JNL74_20570, partial [Fibrobacteres bacterium]|nr:hypothetical protein [Fibrobacterota bacterium]
IVRQYDFNGNYLKTVYPFSADLPYESAKGWKPIKNPDNSTITPVHSNNSLPTYSRSLFDMMLESRMTPSLQFMDENGYLFFGNITNFNTFTTSGGKTDSTPYYTTISSPTLPPTIKGDPYWMFGIALMTRIPGSSDFLVSGVFSGSGDHLTTLDTTGFYRDGRIFRINGQTRAATLYLDINTVITSVAARGTILQGKDDYFAAIHGTAFDAKGRLYVANRVAKAIVVYDTVNMQPLDSIPLAGCDRMEISPATGHIFALARTGSAYGGYLRLFKFAPFDSGAARICSVTVQPTVGGYSSYLNVVDSSAGRKVWVGGNTVSIYNDAGTTLTLFKDFSKVIKQDAPGFDRISVDRRNENVYFNDSWQGIYKITDWSNPYARACSTSAGKRLSASDVVISPFYMLYLRESIPSKTSSKLTRYTIGDGKHTPVNFSNTGNNVVTPYLSHRKGAVVGEKGFAVSNSGIVASLNMAPGGYQLSFYSDTGSADTTQGDVKIFPLLLQCGGLKFDAKGNIYLGAKVTAPNSIINPTFSNDWCYKTSTGNIVRFPAGFDTASMPSTGAITTPSAYKVYPTVIAPFSREPGGGFCVCRSPRFDVDPYGRLFMSNGVTNSVTIADNEGNEIVRFGQYGNIDDPVTDTRISLSWPTSVAASEDYVYVTDNGNNRIARVKMTYEADNYPNLRKYTSVENSRVANSASVKISPNPFNPEASIKVSLPEKMRVRLEVFNVEGRIIKIIASDIFAKGDYRFVWNGTDMNNRVISSGTYYVRLTAGSKELFERITYLR